MRRALPFVVAAALVGASTATAHTESDVDREAVAAALGAHQPEALPRLHEVFAALEATDRASASDRLAALRKEAPRFPAAAELHCAVEFLRERRRPAIEACRAAFVQLGSVHNQRHLAMALAVGPADDPSSQRDLEEASGLALAASLRAPDDPETQVDLCDVAMIAGDGGRLQACAARLDVLLPGDPGTLYFGAYAAAFRGSSGEARALLERAHAAGLPDPIYAEARSELEARRPTLSVGVDVAVRGVAAWFGLLFGLLVIGVGVGRTNAQRATRARGRVPVLPVRGSRGVLRGVLLAGYATGVGAAIGAVGGGALALRGALLAGEVPWITLTFGTALALPFAVLTLRSVTLRFEATPAPGFPLRLEAYPALAAALREASAHVGTVPPRAVWLVPDARLEVREGDSAMRLLGSGGARELLLGVALLEGLRARRFKALAAQALANDPRTAGGFARATQHALDGDVAALRRAGLYVPFNPAAVFAGWMQASFRRVSRGAAALGEAAADRAAGEAFGSAALARGLRRQALRGAHFDLRTDAIVAQVTRTGEPLANLYRFQPETPPSAGKLAEAEQARLDGDRVRAIEDLGITVDGVAGDDAEAWELLGGREGVEVEMTRWFRKQLREDQGLNVPESSRTIPIGR